MKVFFVFLLSITIGCFVSILFFNHFVVEKQYNIKHVFHSQFSLERAPSQSITGDIASFSGTILWESRIATEPAVITQPQQIQQGEEIDTESNSSTTIEFKAIGNMLMQPNTQLQFIQTLPSNIVFAQNQGTVIFNLLRPVTVKSFSLISKITNGICTISVNKITSQITILVKSGSVTSAFNDENNVSTIVPIQAGSKFIFNTTSLTYSITQ